MVAVFSVLLLVAAAAVSLLIRFLRPRFAHHWLLSAAICLAAWILALLARSQIPDNLTLSNWQPRVLLPTAPALVLDHFSASYLLAVITLSVATILTEVKRPRAGERPGGRWFDLFCIIALTGVAGVAVLASNLAAAALLWTFLDLVLLAFEIPRVRNKEESESLVIALSLRLLATMLLIWAGLISAAHGYSTALTGLHPSIAPILLAAAGLRLGLLPPHRPLPEIQELPTGLRASLRLTPAASALVILARAAQSGAAQSSGWLLFLTALAALYAAISWLQRVAIRDGLPFWLTGASALALASAARGQANASLAWGVAALLSGGLLILASSRPRWITPLLLIGALWTTTLPFTPTWPGAALYSLPFPPIGLLFLITQGMLMIGYLRHALRRSTAAASAERWVWLIYPLGLALLPIIQAMIAWWSRPGTSGGMPAWPGWVESSISIFGNGLTLLIISFYFHRARGSPRLMERSATALEFNGLYRLLWSAYHRLRQWVHFVGWALEGRAGILWALLILALLYSLLIQLGLTG